jgi:hypothetical protein
MRHVSYPYQVLYQKGSDIHTWEYRDVRCAKRDYDKQTDFDKVMLLHVSPNNVKCIEQKPMVEPSTKKAKSNKRSKV